MLQGVRGQGVRGGVSGVSGAGCPGHACRRATSGQPRTDEPRQVPVVAEGAGDISLMYGATLVLCDQRQPRDC